MRRYKYKYANRRSAYFSLAVLKNWVLRQSLGTRLPNSWPFFCSPFSGEDLGSFLYIFDCFPGRKVVRKISTYPRVDIWSRVRMYGGTSIVANASLSPFFIRILDTVKYGHAILLNAELIQLLDKIFEKSHVIAHF